MKLLSATNEFLLVRICALLMFFYSLYIIYFIAFTPSVNFLVWEEFFGLLLTKIFSFLFLFSFAFHTWHGMTSIGQDYLHTSSTFGRMGGLSTKIYSSYRLICGFVISLVFLWSLLIIW